MGPYNPKDVTLEVDSVPSGDVATAPKMLENMTAYSFEDGNEGDVRTRVFNRSSPHVRAGEPDQSISLDGLLDWSDAGQTLLRDARKSGATVYLFETYPDGAKVESECKVTDAPRSGSADGEWIENAFTLSVVSTTETAPAP